MSETDEQIRQRLKLRSPTGTFTQDEVRRMDEATLRDYFDRGAFPVTVSWADLVKIRSTP